MRLRYRLVHHAGLVECRINIGINAKIKQRREVVLSYCLSDGGVQNCVNQLHIDKINFGLCRMDIDINIFRIYFYINKITWKTIFRKKFLKSIFDGVMQV